MLGILCKIFYLLKTYFCRVNYTILRIKWDILPICRQQISNFYVENSVKWEKIL